MQAYEYADPVTEFLECLFVRYDFQGAQHKLAECEAVLDGDFFLSALREEFVENARLFIFETYCRIHQVRLVRRCVRAGFGVPTMSSQVSQLYRRVNDTCFPACMM